MNELSTVGNFEELSEDEYLNVDGGLVITGTAVAAGVGCLAGGVTVGYAIGTVIESVME
ncbi:class IIb bacteriocin, lactobin A/cerein 7B family [Halobacteroides halobius DSM 5150]|uniref:Class IIb bacteriocin, lactobin A/cerein 7B family n=1 Tax=Halobacteroides halobius (strain ATCC 35273 / DSM 5150 / MD-1) TaxID=748449 RepID=L0KCR9_HALHC|nr:Blp family class II bacteriocin [Halobacteroides halobius]AGB41868.1 class IIb bacteriocin, lactobin A/cerein 7B family [Halobacteroides halobius DSM 5150]